MCVFNFFIQFFFCACVFLLTLLFKCVCLLIFLCVHVCVCLYFCASVCMCVFAYIFVCACVCSLIFLCKCVFAYTVGVNIKFPYRAVYRPYRTLKKRLARPYRFILLGVTQYYCYTRSEYRAESTFKWIFLLCLYRCCFSRLFLTRPFRFSLSIVSALLVD